MKQQDWIRINSHEELRKILEENKDYGTFLGKEIAIDNIFFTNDIDNNFDKLSDIIRLYLDPIDFKFNNLEKLQDIEQFSSFLTLFKNEEIYVTDQIDKASYYKHEFYTTKKKLLFIFNESLSDQNQLSDVKDIVKSAIKNLGDNLKDFRVIITSNSRVAEMFNIIPGLNDKFTIRLIDYGKAALFSDDDLFQIHDREDKDNGKININKSFILKYRYAESHLNSDKLEEFIINGINNKNQTPYLETVIYNKQVLDSKDKCIKTINSSTFKNDFLNVSGKKIIFGVSNDCVGCVKIRRIIENYLSNEKELKFFEYDRANESQYAKKFRYAPMFFVYQDDKLVSEINVFDFLKESDHYEQDLINLIKRL